MSWDIFVSRTPVDQLEEANLEALGSKQAVAAQLKEILPSVSFNDPDWGNYRDDECSMEISLGEKEEPDHLMLHIRGGENRAISILREICEKFNCFAMDGSTGEQMTFGDSDRNSYQEWQNYRDKVLRNGGDS